MIPLKTEIQIENVKIKTLKMEEWVSDGTNYGLTLYGFELDEFGKRQNTTPEEWVCTVVEYEHWIEPRLVLALFHLLYTQWPHYIKINETLALSGKDGINRELVPPYDDISSIDQKLIENGFKLLSSTKKAERRFRIGLERWSSSYGRTNGLDSILDCCSSLEAVINCDDEKRLRLALSVYYIMDKDRASMKKTYEMYGIRNEFIHGGDIPNISVEKQKEYINTTAEILLQIMKKGVKDKTEIDKKILDIFE